MEVIPPVNFRISDHHPLFADPDPGFQIFADLDSGFEILAHPGLVFSLNLYFYVKKVKKKCESGSRDTKNAYQMRIRIRNPGKSCI